MADLSKEINQALQDYTDEVEKGLQEAKKSVAKEAVKQIKHKAPVATGDYKKGWGVKQKGSARIIRNRTEHQLTHLLEFGHAKRNGGRVRGYAHIRPVEDWAIEAYEKQAEKVIRG